MFMKIKFITQDIKDITEIQSVDYMFITNDKTYSFNIELADILKYTKHNVFGFDVHPSVIRNTISVDVVVNYKNGNSKRNNYVNLQDLQDNTPQSHINAKQIKSFNTTTLFQTNTASSYDNTAEQKQLVIDILEDMFETIAVREGDVIRGNKNLIYSSVFGQGYYELYKLLMLSIDNTTTNKTFDVLIITDAPTKRRITSSAFAKKFNISYMVIDTPANGVEASKTKCKIFDWEKINDYNKILFLDSDIIAFDDISSVFGLEYESGCLYTAYNNNMNFDVAFNSKYYSITPATDEMLQAYKSQNQQPFNAGQFLFINSLKMQEHFSNINWFMNNWPGEYFFEQSFMVQYFCRNFLTNSTVLNKIFTIKSITPSVFDPENVSQVQTPFIHFAGAALNSTAKVEYIKKYIAEYANIV